MPRPVRGGTSVTPSREHEGPAPSRALARVVSDPEGFEAAWGQEALHATAAELPGAFDDLFTLEAVDELLSTRGLRTPFLRLAKEGSIVSPARFTRSGGVGAEIGDQIDDAAVARLFADGSTIVLQALHRTWAPLGAFARDLGAELGHPVQVNAYVTPPSSRGFSAHYDIHDVFVLQIAGEKRWVAHAPVLDAPLRTQPWTERRNDVERAVADEPLFDVVLRPGDVLYLPRGFLHAAEALGAVSAHLTVGIHVVTRHALLQALVGLAANDERLRRSLPVPLELDDPALVGRELEETRAALLGFLEELDPEHVAGALKTSLATATRPEPVAPLRQVGASASVGPATCVRLRPGLRVELETTLHGTALTHPAGAIELGPTQEPAARALLEGAAWLVAELPGDEGSVGTLVRALLADSIVVPVE